MAGIEPNPAWATVAEQVLDVVVCKPVEDALSSASDIGVFDCIVCADVLEHLVDPWATLTKLADSHLDPEGFIVVSLPNVQHWSLGAEVLLRGTWPRRESGLFDRTHLRWFTRSDAIALLGNAGLEVKHIEGVYGGERWENAVLNGITKTSFGQLLARQYLFVGKLR